MADPLPTFRYHPDPVGTGSVVPSATKCLACGRARGFVYAGPVYAREEFDNCICPWCIADGSAHADLRATFTGAGEYGDWSFVPARVVAEVARRTPGFNGWQQQQWWIHCGDGAAFVGRAGRAELEAAGPDAIAAVRAGVDYTDEEWRQIQDAMDRDGSPTAYLFRCLHCGQVGGYWDCH